MPIRTDASDPPKLSNQRSAAQRPSLRIGAMLTLFLGLTLLGIWWAAPDPKAISGSWREFVGLPWPIHLLLAALSIGLIGSEMLRTVIFGRALGVKIDFRTSLDTTIADNFFSWLTPGASLGDVASLFMLRRRGVPWDAAAIIVFGEFATGFAFIMGLGGLLLALGFGPSVVPWIGFPLALATAGVSLLLCALFAGAFWPSAVTAFIDRATRELLQTRFSLLPVFRRLIEPVAREARSAVQRLARFRSAGAAGVLAILASHTLYYGNFVGILVTLAIAFQVHSWTEFVPSAIIYQGFLYVAPTPGGAGLGEASANLFFDSVLPGAKAFVVVMLFRLLTFYLQILIGLVYLPLIGVLGEILRLGRTGSSPDRAV